MPFGQNEKRYRPENWYTPSPRPYLKTGFLFDNPEGLKPRKTAVSRGFSAFLLDYLVENYIYINGGILYQNKIESKNMPVVVNGNEFRTLWFHV